MNLITRAGKDSFDCLLKRLEAGEAEHSKRSDQIFTHFFRSARKGGYLVATSEDYVLASEGSVTEEEKISKSGIVFEALPSASRSSIRARVGQLLVHMDRKVAIAVAQGIIEPKKTMERIQEFEYGLVLRLIEFSLKSSDPDFRHNALVVIKRLMLRVNEMLIPIFRKDPEEKDATPCEVADFQAFIDRFYELFDRYVYPDAAFEAVNHYLDLTKTLFGIFGEKQVKETNAKRKKVTVEAGKVKICPPWLFEKLAMNLNSPCAGVRTTSFELLKLIPPREEFIPPQLLARIDREIEHYETVLNPREIETISLIKAVSFWHRPAEQKLFAISEIIERIEAKISALQMNLENDENFLKNAAHRQLSELVRIFSAPELMTELLVSNSDAAKNIAGSLTKNLCKIAEICEFYLSLSQKPAAEQKCFAQLLGMGNALVEGPEEQNNPTESDNVPMIVFYLQVKELALLFHAVIFASLRFSTSTGRALLTREQYESLQDVFFRLLMSLKHIGSVDKVSEGLFFMYRSFYDLKENHRDLPDQCIRRVFEIVKGSSFNSVLRRSAGIPAFLTSVMRASVAFSDLGPSKMIMEELISLAGSDDSLTRIHSINSLRFIVQDSQLKVACQQHVAHLLQLVITGFSSKDWSVKNSSLMLYTAIVRKILFLTDRKKAGQMRLIDFFSIYPVLLPFFKAEFAQFSKTKEDSAYPSIYPICLLLSKLATTYVGSPEEAAETQATASSNNPSYISTQELRELFGAMIDCLPSSNYHTRSLIGKALCAFISPESPDSLSTLLPGSLEDFLENSNKTHARLSCLRVFLEEILDGDSAKPHQIATLGPQDKRAKVVRSIDEALKPFGVFLFSHAASPLKVEFLKICCLILASTGVGPSEQVAKFLETSQVGRLAFGSLRSEEDFGDSYLSLVTCEYFFMTSTPSNISAAILLTLSTLEKTIEKVVLNDYSPTEKFLKCIFRYKAEAPRSALEPLFVTLSFLAKHPTVCALTAPLMKLFNKLFFPSGEADLARLPSLLSNLRRTYKHNEKVLREVLAALGKAIAQSPSLETPLALEFLDQHLKLVQSLSDPNSKDVERLFAVESLKLTAASIERLKEDSFLLFARYQMLLIRLVQDEVLPVREEAAEAAFAGREVIFNENFGLNILITRLFTLSASQHSLPDSEFKELVRILGFLLFGQETAKYKYEESLSNSLFKIERPNKFAEDELVKRLSRSAAEKHIISNQRFMRRLKEIGIEAISSFSDVQAEVEEIKSAHQDRVLFKTEADFSKITNSATLAWIRAELEKIE